MSQHAEVEAKLELDLPGFRTLCAAGTLTQRKEQLNVYYDSSWQLATAAATFRIRFCPADVALVTFKVPESHDGWTRRSQEHEVTLAQLCLMQSLRSGLPRAIDVEYLPSSFRSVLNGLQIRRLFRVGWVRNTRYVINLIDSLTIEVDQLRLPGGRDFFEVEIEHTNENVRRRLIDCVLGITPQARGSRMSKFERFRSAVNEMNRATS